MLTNGCRHVVVGLVLLGLQWGVLEEVAAQDNRPYNTPAATLKQMQDNINTMRHGINNHESELHQFEEKFASMEEIVDGLRRQFNDLSKGHKDQLHATNASLGARIGDFEIISKGIVADLQQIKVHVNESTANLFQYQQQLIAFEKQMQIQNKNIENLQAAMKTLMELLQPSDETDAAGQIYQVKAGDSLERIANLNSTSVKALKELNSLSSDRIRIGQKLRLPTK